MPRWLTRMLFLSIIAVVVAVVVSRLTNQEEDFDDFEDIEAGFDFQETPVEIDVPVEEGTTGSEASSGTDTDDTSNIQSRRAGSAQDTSFLETTDEEGHPLTSVSGIGAAYEARLQAIGINSVEELAQADVASINEQIDVIGGESTVEAWVEQARSIASEEPQGGSDGSAGR